MIDDDRFLSIVKERLKEWNGNIDDEQFIAVWSAADYRLKYYNTLEDAKEKIEALMKVFNDVGFTPQYDVCGPPTIDLQNIFMAPKGDISYSTVSVNGTDVFQERAFITVYLSGVMRPLMTIAPHNAYSHKCVFSNDSQYLAIPCNDRVEIWETFALKRVMVFPISGLVVDIIMRWSCDSSRLLVHNCGQTSIIDVATKEKKDVNFGEIGIREAALNHDGSITMILLNNEILYLNTSDGTATSRFDIPISFSGNALSFYCKDRFIIVAGGFILSAPVGSPPSIIKDYRDKIELSMTAQALIDHAPTYTSYPGNYIYDRRELVNGKIVFMFNKASIIYRCVIDPADLSYDLSVMNESMIEKGTEAVSVVPDDEPTESIDPSAILDEGGVLDVFYEGTIIRFRFADCRRGINLYVIQEYNTKMPYRQGEIRFIKQGFMDQFGSMPEKLCGDPVLREEYVLITKDGRSPTFYQVSPSKDLDVEDLPFVYEINKAPNMHRVWEKIYDPNYPNCLISLLEKDGGGNRFRSEECLVYDGKGIVRINKPSEYFPVSLTRDMCFYRGPGGIYRLNLEGRTFDLIITYEEMKTFGDIFWEDITGDARIIIGSRYADEKDLKKEIVAIIDHNLIPLVKIRGDSQYIYHNGKLFYTKESTIHVIDIESREEIKFIDCSDENKWIVLGVNNSGVISLAKYQIEWGSIHSSGAEIDFGRLSPEAFEIERFESAHLSIKSSNNLRYSMDFRGNRVMYRTSTENPVRPYALTTALIKKNGINNGNTLVPDQSRLNSEITVAGDGRYILTTNGRYEDEKGDNDRSKVRPIMRLMSVDSGRMVRLKKLRNTEGMMYGVKGFSAEGARIVPLADGTFIAAGFMNGFKSAVTTRDVSSGKEYPESGRTIHGMILDNDDETITVGLTEPDGDTYVIRRTVKYDKTMEPIDNSEESLNVPIRYGVNGWEYDISAFDPVSIYDYIFDGMVVKSAFKPHSRDPLDMGSIDIEKPTALISVLSINKISSDIGLPCPMSRDMQLNWTSWCDSKVLLFTLHRGKIIDPVCGNITIPVNNRDDPSINDITDTITRHLTVKKTDDGYVVVQLLCENPNIQDELWSYHAFIIRKNGSVEDMGQDIIGPAGDYYGTEYAVSIAGTGVNFVHFVEGVPVHTSFDSKKSFPIQDCGYPYAIYMDDRISVTYEDTDDRIIVTDGKETEFMEYKTPLKITDWYTDSDGCTHLVSKKSHITEELTIPADIHDMKLGKPKESPGTKVYNLGKHRIQYCQGLYGVKY